MNYLNQIFCEDCMSGLDRIPDRSIGLVIMDPPYQLDESGRGGGLLVRIRDNTTPTSSQCRQGLMKQLLTRSFQSSTRSTFTSGATKHRSISISTISQGRESAWIC